MRATWILVVATACDSGGAAPDAAPEPDAGLLCTHIQNLRTFRGKAQTFGSTNGQPFPGMICVDGRTDIACPTPDTNRDFEMCVPSSGDFALHFTAAAFENTVYLEGPQAMSSTVPFTVGDNAYVGTQFWGAIGGSYPPTAVGHLVVMVVDEAGAPLANAEVAILPSNGLTVVYVGANGLPDLARPNTAAPGTALIADVMPGDYDLQVNLAGRPNCAFATGGHVSPDNSQDARIKVTAGVTTIAALACRP